MSVIVEELTVDDPSAYEIRFFAKNAKLRDTDHVVMRFYDKKNGTQLYGMVLNGWGRGVNTVEILKQKPSDITHRYLCLEADEGSDGTDAPENDCEQHKTVDGIGAAFAVTVQGERAEVTADGVSLGAFTHKYLQIAKYITIGVGDKDTVLVTDTSIRSLTAPSNTPGNPEDPSWLSEHATLAIALLVIALAVGAVALLKPGKKDKKKKG